MNCLFDLQKSAQLALRCLDLTSLNDADTEVDIAALCQRAKTAYGPVAAVCVWPRFVALARSLLPTSVQPAALSLRRQRLADRHRVGVGRHSHQGHHRRVLAKVPPRPAQ